MRYRLGLPRSAARRAAIPQHGERLVAAEGVEIMDASRHARKHRDFAHCRRFSDTVNCGPCAFIQILSKFYFFQLIENLRLILFDYGQNRAVGANVTFNAAC